MSAESLILDGGSLDPAALERAARGEVRVEASLEARERVRASRGVIDRILLEGRTVYGVNTGFGKFSNVSIPPDSIRDLQRRLVRSHAAGVGAPLEEEVVRAMMVLKANELLRGRSGVREEVVDALLDGLNAGLWPVVPEQGSVGASGDLAPLAHIALALMGEGEAFRDGEPCPSGEVLEDEGLEPLALEAKDGLALINGTQLTTALLCLCLTAAERLARCADIVSAMTMDALLASVRPADERIHSARPHPGQAASARNIRRLLEGSQLVASHADCSRVQDAYSLRCTPQVHGAVRAALAHARGVAEIEVNSSTDNPLVFPAEEEGGEADVLSGGNFHAQLPAQAADTLTLGLTQLAGISERRLERLVNPALSEGLPAFLVEQGGLNSGLMMVQVTAAALVVECRVLATPASAHSISTSADQEDFVSMGPLAGRKARAALECAETVLAVELLAACQALDLRAPVKTTPALRAVHALVRERVPFLDEDRVLARDIEAVTALVWTGAVPAAAAEALGAPLD